MISVNLVLFVFICIFAGIGALLTLFIVIYLIIGIIDLTYFDRHKHKIVHCPEYIEGEDKRKEL